MIRTQSHICSHFSLDFHLCRSGSRLNTMNKAEVRLHLQKDYAHYQADLNHVFDRNSAIAISLFCWWGKCRQIYTAICLIPCRSWCIERVLLTLYPAPHRHSGQPQQVFLSLYTEGVVGCGVESPWLLLHGHVKKHTLVIILPCFLQSSYSEQLS